MSAVAGMMEYPNAFSDNEREDFFARLREKPAEPAVAQIEAASGAETAHGPDTAVAFESSPEEPTPPPVVTYDEGKPAAVVTLKHPFTIGGRRIDELRLSPPTFGDVEGALTREISVLELYARMAGVPVDALRALRWPDAEAFTAKAQKLAPMMEGR